MDSEYLSQVKQPPVKYSPNVGQETCDPDPMAKVYVQSERDHRAVAWMRFFIERRFGSRYALSKALGISESHLSKIFNGERGVGIKLFDALRSTLDVSTTQLLDDNPPAKYWQPLPEENRRGRRSGVKEKPVSRAPASRLRGAGR